VRECPDRSYQTRKLGTAKRKRLFRGVGQMSLRRSLSALLLLLLLPCNCTALSITVSLASLHSFPAQEEKLRLVRPPRRGTSLSALNLISAASCTHSASSRTTPFFCVSVREAFTIAYMDAGADAHRHRAGPILGRVGRIRSVQGGHVCQGCCAAHLECRIKR
jgi:hypothetical protein